MNKTFRQTLACLLAALFFLMIPVPGARAGDDDSNVNKGVLTAVFVVVIGIVVWLGFKSDMEDRTFAELNQTPWIPPADAEPEERVAMTDEMPELILAETPLALNADGIGFVF